MALLVAICGAVGLFSYASMDSFLTRQLDNQLTEAARPLQRVRPARRSATRATGPIPSEARGQGVGTL